MSDLLRLSRAVAVAAAMVVLAAVAARAAETASLDDTAKFLAGMQPSAASPLAKLTREPAWKAHAQFFDTAWKGLEERQLSKVRAWSKANLAKPQKTMFYMFSGPDYLYANAFYPHADTYILSGLERIGPIPDATNLPPKRLAGSLEHLRGSLNNILNLSYFITINMQKKFGAGQFTGTLPVLYVFLARSGKTITDVSFVELDAEGIPKPRGETTQKGVPVGVKIVFTGAEGRVRTLYYFRTDLADTKVRSTGFLKFCARHAPGDSLIKSASYLLHYGTFSEVRNFLLEHSARIVQDDTGIRFRDFPPGRFALTPFGNYVRPIPIFRRLYQKDLSEFFRRQKPAKVDFGIGYRYRVHETSILLAVRQRSPETKRQ